MNKDIWRIRLLRYILSIGFIALSVYAVIYYLHGDFALSFIEGVCGIAMLFGYYLTHRGYYLMSAFIGWCGIFAVLVLLLVSGGIAGSGLVWWALIPVISFIMFGLTGGALAVTIAVVTLLLAAILKQYGLFPIYFEIGRLVQTAIAISVIGAIMYVFEKISGATREEAIAKAVLLEKTENDLQKNLGKIEIEKQEQTDVSRAVVNILEDSKELERKLGEEKDKATAIISSMGEGLFVLDKNHRLELVNPVAEKLLGIKQSEAIGKDWAEIAITLKGDKPIDFSDRTTMQALKSGKTIATNIEDDHYYQIKTGKKFPITSITTPLIKNNEVVGVIKVFKDVTLDKHSKEVIEQKVVERTKELQKANEEINKGWLQIQQEKAKLSASIENMPVGFLMTDILGNLLIVNSLANKNLGVESDSEAYTILKKILASKVDLIKYLHDCNKDTKTLVYRDINLPDGRFIKVFISPILVSDKSQNIKCTGMVILVDDITEAKILERSKDEFFSIASHELRTPLTAIRGNTSMMKDMYADKLKDPDLIEMIDDVHTSAIRLINIVNDFLNVSRLEMGKIDFKKTDFDLVPLASEVITELTDQAQEKKLKLYLTSKIKTLNVFSDRDRTREVLINLIGNAIKYTEKGEIDVDFSKDKDSTKVLIRDTGAGITLEGQKLLFHKFQQAGDSILTRDTTRSTGLGLYISKLIVEGMGGTIALESSTPGKGSTFSFTLPIK